jgi:hypothetical protein
MLRIALKCHLMLLLKGRVCHVASLLTGNTLLKICSRVDELISKELNSGKPAYKFAVYGISPYIGLYIKNPLPHTWRNYDVKERLRHNQSLVCTVLLFADYSVQWTSVTDDIETHSVAPLR